MSEIQKEKFIKELKNKLNQKTYGNTYEETLLVRAFKYFDLDNTGKCDMKDFIRTVHKIGVTSFEDEEIQEIFKLYDKDNSGKIDYKEFVSEIYENKSLSKKQKKTLLPENFSKKVSKEIEPELNEKKNEQQNNIEYTVDDIISLIRKKLNKMGVKGICSIERNFRIVDENNSQTVDFNDFQKSCNNFNFGLNEQQMKTLFEYFDKDNTGEIDYDEFIRGIRGEMNEFRQKLVQKAFEILDVNKSGEITFEDIQNKYNADNHPEVLNGQKSEDEIFNEFMDTFQDTYNYLCGTETDNIITIEEFMEYYENVSMTIDDDLYFEYLLNNTWKLGLNVKYSKKEEKKEIQKKSPKKEEINKEEEDKKNCELSLIKFINDIKNFGTTNLISLLKLFKLSDEDNTKEIELYDFIKALNNFDTALNDEEISWLFNYFDKERYGFIKYVNFINAIRGSMNPKRLAIVKEAFKKLDIDKSGQVELSFIKSQFNAKNNEDVKSGKKTEQEVYDEFIESFQLNHDIRVGPRNKRVTLDEFIDYYDYVSMGIDDDLTFIYLIQNSWKVNPNYSKVLMNQKEEKIDEEVSYLHGELKNPKMRVGAAAAPFGTDMTPPTEDRRKTEFFYDFKDKEEEVSPMEIFRNTLQKRGIRGVMSMRRAFMIADENDNKTINLPDFLKYFHDYRIPIKGKEINLLFEEFDKNKKGIIHYEEFIGAFVKEMNERRKRLIKILFDSFDKNKLGFISLEELRNCYTPVNHPDVLIGKKTEDEVLAEFLDSLQYHFSLLKSKKENEDKISLDDLYEYYNYISFGIEDDDYFESMIKNGFNLEERRPKKKGWKSIV